MGQSAQAQNPDTDGTAVDALQFDVDTLAVLRINRSNDKTHVSPQSAKICSREFYDELPERAIPSDRITLPRDQDLTQILYNTIRPDK